MGKITRVRTGCWTCKKRHRKCDEAKPSCNNCIKTNRPCEGYDLRLSFDVDDNRKRPKQKSVINKDSFKEKSIVHSLENLQELKKLSFSDKSERSVISNYDLSAELDNLVKNKVFSPRPFQNLGIKSSSNNLDFFSSELFEGIGVLFDSIDSKEISDDEKGTAQTNSSNVQALPKLASNEKPNIQSSTMLDILPNHEFVDFKDANSNNNKYSEIHHDQELAISGSLNSSSLYSLSHQEENMLLKHFFQKLLPLLDAHPESPWPDLALKYCDFNIARSCFISLACIHIYECGQGGKEYYNKGMAHINKTMDYLIKSINSNENGLSGLHDSTEAISSSIKKQVSAFVVLVLVNVHILFAVLEKGKSTCSRFFFKVFASICQDQFLYDILMENEKKASLVVVLSWYDTVSAIVSPDCRLPFCSPTWYGSSKDTISTSKMMGCPGEIFKAMSKVCFLRHDLKKLIRNNDVSLLEDYEDIKRELLQYRDYVSLDGKNYSLRLKGAQCWSLATYACLNRTTRIGDWENNIRKIVEEFIDVYASMDSRAPVVTQMVWPVYAIGCECKTEYQREKLLSFMDTLYSTAQMGTLVSLKTIVLRVWETKLTQEEVLEEWLDANNDYLPL
ncbi:uncharacterized protein PRCAT00004833001 [Priceomyces carsonii]|uniref:uncharacterized protein n=1 Tax=Priceomyces carsonii TaxID=28549 RepID=UPI002ED81309|nr:unnamed protein product [Priceomyces carsonii]